MAVMIQVLILVEIGGNFDIDQIVHASCIAGGQILLGVGYLASVCQV